MNSGIYAIYNVVNGKCYIGSTKNFKKRFKRHLSDLKFSRHHSIYLQRAYDKYGKESFEFIILKMTDILFTNEKKWIGRLLPEYNLGSVGGGDNTSNHPNLDEIKKKQSIATKQKYENMTHEEYENCCESVKGDKNPNWKGGICTNNKCIDCGVAISPYRERCKSCCQMGNKNGFYGKSHSDETKEKLRKKQMGKKPPNSTKIEINNKIYDSLEDASKDIGVSRQLISYRLKKGYEGYIKL